MALRITLDFLAAIAGCVSAAQAHATRDVATGFFDFCDQTSLSWYAHSSQQAIIADCSTTGNPVYYQSWIDLNYCFANDDGTMAMQIDGAAFATCSCEMGEQITSCRPYCNSTQIQCACDDKNGGTKANNLDLNDFIGLGFDDDDHLVMECYSAETETLVKGTFLECTQYGYTTDCE